VASVQALVDEVDELLEEDNSLNQIWSAVSMLDIVQMNMRLLSSETLARDVRTNLTLGTSGISVATPSDYISCYHIRWLGSGRLDIEDQRLGELMTGVTDPYAIGTPSFATEVFCDDEIKTLKMFPPYGSSGATVTIYYKAEFDIPAALTSGVSIQDIFKLPLKLRMAADALEADTDGYDPQKVKVFSTFADVLVGALKSLYQGNRLL
jgi:hypothetical protein